MAEETTELLALFKSEIVGLWKQLESEKLRTAELELKVREREGIAGVNLGRKDEAVGCPSVAANLSGGEVVALLKVRRDLKMK